MSQSDPRSSKNQPGQARIPAGSLFFERIVPVLLIVMGVLMFGLILFAVAVLFGLI